VEKTQPNGSGSPVETLRRSMIAPGGIVRETQTKLFSRVLDVITPMADLINTVVEFIVDERVEVREWPRTA
jgi:hypothetical protein